VKHKYFLNMLLSLCIQLYVYIANLQVVKAVRVRDKKYHSQDLLCIPQNRN